MSSRSSSKRRNRLSRAEIKAYESRRAAERARISASTATNEPELLGPEVLQHSYTLTRDEEFIVIRQDLVRLLWIVALLLVALVVATIVLG